MEFEGKIVKIVENTGTRLNAKGEEVAIDEQNMKVEGENFSLLLTSETSLEELKIGEDVVIKISQPQKKLGEKK